MKIKKGVETSQYMLEWQSSIKIICNKNVQNCQYRSWQRYWFAVFWQLFWRNGQNQMCVKTVKSTSFSGSSTYGGSSWSREKPLPSAKGVKSINWYIWPAYRTGTLNFAFLTCFSRLTALFIQIFFGAKTRFGGIKVSKAAFKILLRSGEKHVVSAGFQGFGSYFENKWVKLAQFVVFLRFLSVFSQSLLRTLRFSWI